MDESDIGNHTATEGGIPSLCFNGRSFIGKTPIIEVSQDQPIRFYVFNLDLGMIWHNFHTHAMRWKMPILKFNLMNTNNDIVREDVRSIGPAESFVLDVNAPPVMLFDDPAIEEQQPNPPPEPDGWNWYDIYGDFLFHCHVEPHMSDGLAGLIRVKRRIWLYDEQFDAIEKTTGLPVYDPNQPIACPEIDLTRCESLELGKWELIRGMNEQESKPGVTMMHAILIPKTNKILFWGYYTFTGQGKTRILDVDNTQTPYSDTDNFPHQVVPFSGVNAIICANIWSAEHTFLNTDEGTILVHGGLTGMISGMENYWNRQTFLYHPDTSGGNPPWEFLGGTDPNNLQNMNTDGRFYATTITLDDGKVLTLFGSFDSGSHVTSFSLEIFDLNAPPNKWMQPIPITSDQWPNYMFYPWTYQLPDGELFISGPKARTIKFSHLSPDIFTEYPGSAGDRDPNNENQEGTSSLLPLRPSDSYAPRIIIAGGETPETMNSLQLIDLSEADASWRDLPNLAYPRKHQTNSVILADGTILFCGGAVNSNGIQIAGESEIFDPKTGELKTVASNLLIRGYHSAAILLTDGTVVLGGDPYYGGLGANRECERYKPAYYFKQRPVISDNNFPQTINYGGVFEIEIENNPDEIVEAAIIRPGAVTHGWNMTQRYIELSITGRLTNPNRLQIEAPPDGKVAPPGPYFLVILTGGTCIGDDCEGPIPSVGKWVRLT
jgi:hypothetical protein